MYKFTIDFNANGGALTNVEHIIRNFGVPNTIIEIGVFEGKTTFTLSDELTPHNKNLHIYAVDPHVGSIDMREDPIVVQETFAENLKHCANKNVTYIRKHSEDGLIDLINQGVKAELIYVDGDHRSPQVLTDLVLSFKLLVKGGIMLCDDTGDWKYIDNNGTASAQMSPRLAVEMFMACHWHLIKPLTLPNSGQTAFIKL
jgi:hypothetical protein